MALVPLADLVRILQASKKHCMAILPYIMCMGADSAILIPALLEFSGQVSHSSHSISRGQGPMWSDTVVLLLINRA